MKDARCIIPQVSNVVDDGYKIKVYTSAEFKVFPQHLPYKSNYRITQFRFTMKFYKGDFRPPCSFYAFSGAGATAGAGSLPSLK